MWSRHAFLPSQGTCETGKKWGLFAHQAEFTAGQYLLAEHILIKEWLKMSKVYEQQTAKAVLSCWVGQVLWGRFRTLIICSSKSQRKLLAQFKGILIVPVLSSQGTLQRAIYFSHKKMKWGLCFFVSYQLRFPTKTFQLFLHASPTTAWSSKDFPDAITYSQCSYSQNSAKQTILPPGLLTLPDNDSAVSPMIAVFQHI